MDHVRVFFLLSPKDFHTIWKTSPLNARKTYTRHRGFFVVVVFLQGFTLKVDMSDFAILQFLFSHKDSLEKWPRQGSWRTMAQRHFLHSRTGILFKSCDDRGPRRSLFRYMFCVLVQGFSIKVAIKVLVKAYCTFIGVDKTLAISSGITHLFEDESC